MEKQISVLQIVPGFSPQINGIGDYARIFERHFEEDSSVASAILVCNTSWENSPAPTRIHLFSLKERSSNALEASLERLPFKPNIIFLHFSNFGYDKRGTPSWLFHGLKKWLSNHSQVHLITFFHELYAMGPLWKSTFWFSILQRYVTRNFAKISKYCITNNSVYARWLLKNKKDADVLVLPVFSTIGEPLKVPNWSTRKKQAIVFGNKGQKELLYRENLRDLIYWLKLFNIETIIDIGSKPQINSAFLGTTPVSFLGIAPEEKISEILMDSQIGFINYSFGILAKSTIFSAYSSHGMLPIIFNKKINFSPDFKPFEHFIPSGKIPSLGDSLPEKIVKDVFKQYSQRNSFKQCNEIIRKFRNLTS